MSGEYDELIRRLRTGYNADGAEAANALRAALARTAELEAELQAAEEAHRFVLAEAVKLEAQVTTLTEERDENRETIERVVEALCAALGWDDIDGDGDEASLLVAAVAALADSAPSVSSGQYWNDPDRAADDLAPSVSPDTQAATWLALIVRADAQLRRLRLAGDAVDTAVVDEWLDDYAAARLAALADSAPTARSESGMLVGVWPKKVGEDTVDLAAADGAPSVKESGFYRCAICDRRFDTYQELGDHIFVTKDHGAPSVSPDTTGSEQ